MGVNSFRARITCVSSFVGFLLLGLLSACATPNNLKTVRPPQDISGQADLLSQFEDTLVANVGSPTALAFTPDGQLLIATQPGQLRVLQNGALRSTPVLDLASRLCTNGERGLLGVAVDPGFVTNGYIYLFYTFDEAGTGTCARSIKGSAVHRVSRFTMSGNTASLSSERILINNIPSPFGNHSSGDLQIGKDGLLYISVGDGNCDYRGDSGCGGENDASRDKHTLLGKVLRITKTGGIPSGNPYQSADSARCNNGNISPGKVCQETYASGLRNPFRMAFDPNASSTRFYINDVGQNVWEEINLGQSGADYGWNLREGRCKNGSSSDCGTPAGLTNPIFSYQHTSTGTFGSCASITGGAFVPSGIWPSSFIGSYLFSDYVCGKIFKLTKTGDGYSASVFASGLGSSSAVHLAFGPHGSSQALYYTSYADGGQVRRIAYTGSSNRAPQATVSASPTFGTIPLTVRVSAEGSRDPDGDALSYRWSFGDGGTASGASVSYTYRAKGTYTVTLTAQDPQGAKGTATVRIDAGNTPPSPRITSPDTSTRFGVGQTVVLRGQATDAEDGGLAGSRLSWRAILHHNSHTHPYLASTSGQEVRITMPAPEDLAATKTSHLEVFLTATDSRGLSRTVNRKVYPALVDVTFRTDPTGLKLKVNGVTFTAPRTFTLWKGYKLNASASTQTTSSGTTATFRSWSDGGAASHTITTPASTATYTARFNVR